MTKIWTWLKNNFGVVLNIGIVVIGIVIVGLDMTGRASLEAVREATLALLSLIGASLLMNHTTNSQLQQATDNILQTNQTTNRQLQQATDNILQTNQTTNRQLQQTTEEILECLQKPPIDRILVPYGRWMEEIEQRLWFAREVWILSRTCTRLWQDYHDQLMKLLLDDRGIVRLMLVDPNGSAVKMIVGTAEGLQNSSNLNLRRATIEDLLIRLARLRSQLGEESLQVRTIDYLPAWTLVFIDPWNGKGVAYVELAAFRANPRNRPTFSLMAERELQLFQKFRDEFETMWNCARSFDTMVSAGATT